MSTPILRGLAKAYGDGLIDRKQYIRERRHLIDDIVAGKVEIIPYEAESPTRAPDPERTFSDGESTLEIPRFDPEAETRPVDPPKSGRTGPAIAAIAVIAVGAAAAYGGWRLLATNPPLPVPDVAPVSTPERTAPNPAAVLLDGFLEQNNWRAERIESFLLAWEGESDLAREALTDTPAMRRATDLIAQQLVEEKALYELGEREEALHKQRRLLDLAAALLITNDRLARAEAEWQQNSAAFSAETAAAVEPAAVAATTTPLPSEQDEPRIDPVMVESDTAVMETPPEPANVPPEPPPERDEPPPEPVESSMAIPETATAAPLASAPTPAPEVASKRETPAATAQAAVKPSPKRSGCRAELARERRPYCRDALARNVNGPVLAVLPGGEAVVGGVKPEEQPRFTVRLQRPFGLGVFEVSVDELNAFCQATGRACPAQPWSDPKFPAVNVSWSLATEYTDWLSKKTGATYRLPSESEWEYAARAGTSTPYPFGDELLPTHARFSFRGPESAPLAANDRTVNRNKFRLYHMVGNVREWVLDAWHDDHTGAAKDGGARIGNTGDRVARGGSYADGADRVRSASRARLNGSSGDTQTGFRVLREID